MAWVLALGCAADSDDGEGDDMGALAEASTGAGSTGTPASSGGTWDDYDTDPGCLDGGCSEGWIDDTGADDPPGLCDHENDDCIEVPQFSCGGPDVCGELTVTLDAAGDPTFGDPAVAACMLESLRDYGAVTHAIVETGVDGLTITTRIEALGNGEIAVRSEAGAGEGCDAAYATVSHARAPAAFSACLGAADHAGMYACLLEPVTKVCVDSPACP
jgi:hypothetical protein